MNIHIIAETKYEGLNALPSKKFKNNNAFLQILLLSMNIWRYLKIIAAKSDKVESDSINKKKETKEILKHPIVLNTARIIRLKLLYICAKIVNHGNQTKIRYLEHDNRIHEFTRTLDYLDFLRKIPKLWEKQQEGDLRW